MTTAEQIAVMVIKVGMTQQPESYTSVRRDIELPVFIRPEDDAVNIARVKMAEAVKIVEDSIDDDFERGHGARAKYSDEPRYDFLEWDEKGIAVIFPSKKIENLPRGWEHINKRHYQHRLKHLKTLINEEKYPTILDCSENFEALLEYPVIYKGILSCNQDYQIAILTEKGKEPPQNFKNQFPNPKKGWSPNWNQWYQTNFYDEIIAWGKKQAEKENFELYICWDGDLNQIPVPKTTTEPEPDDEDEEDYEEDDDIEDEEDDEETAESLF